jgi:hypothetical protein
VPHHAASWGSGQAGAEEGADVSVAADGCGGGEVRMGTMVAVMGSRHGGGGDVDGVLVAAACTLVGSLAVRWWQHAMETKFCQVISGQSWVINL